MKNHLPEESRTTIGWLDSYIERLQHEHEERQRAPSGRLHELPPFDNEAFDIACFMNAIMLELRVSVPAKLDAAILKVSTLMRENEIYDAMRKAREGRSV